MGEIMLSNYTAQRIRNLFSANDQDFFKLSRSRIENFLRCPRCFYLDRKHGVDQPPMFPYTLNNAVDTLLKKEFDVYRAQGAKHPYLIEHGIDAIPFAHPELDNWRMNQRGVRYEHQATGFLVHGAVDDIWVTPQGELIVVDYKATSTKDEVSLTDRDSYKRQMEVYQWLLRKNGFTVSNTGYFVYCNGDAGREGFSDTLNFKISLLPYEGNDTWVDTTLHAIKNCLSSDVLPPCTATCNYCNYVENVNKHVAALTDQKRGGTSC